MILPVIKPLDQRHTRFVGASIDSMENDVAGSRQMVAGSVGYVSVEDEMVIFVRNEVSDERNAHEAIIVPPLVVLDAALVPRHLFAGTVEHTHAPEQIVGVEQRIHTQFHGGGRVVHQRVLVREDGQLGEVIACLGIELHCEVLRHGRATAMLG